VALRPSSRRWLARQRRDPFVREARSAGWRSRAAFKLLEIDRREHLFRPGLTVVDLGAAPGGWSQVAAARVAPGGRVVAVDEREVAPLRGVTVLRGDLRRSEVRAALRAALAGRPADLVLSDLAPDLTGIASTDQARALELAMLALELAQGMLGLGGVLVLKAFHGEGFGVLRAALEKRFRRVKVVKPQASRPESRETYFVAHGPRKCGGACLPGQTA